MSALIPLNRKTFTTMARVVSGFRQTTTLHVDVRRTNSGVEMVRLSNYEGWVDVLPFMGAVVWDACFYGVRLGTSKEFEEPHPTTDGVGLCGCPLYHAWERPSDVPGPEDNHASHDEAPYVPMDRAQIELRDDEDGPEVVLICTTCHQDSGATYSVNATVALRRGATEFETGMEVRNRGTETMNLMCAARTNFTFVAGGHILQPAPWNPAHVHLHTSLPGYVHASPELMARIDALAKDPRRLTVLDPALCEPELVFSLSGLRTDPDGWAHLAMQQDRGDGFTLSYNPSDFPHVACRLVHSPGERAVGFALRSGFEPQGYAALAPRALRRFRMRLGYLEPEAMKTRAKEIVSA